MQSSRESEQKCYFLILIFKEKKRERERGGGKRGKDLLLLRSEFSITVNSISRVNKEDNVSRNLIGSLCAMFS